MSRIVRVKNTLADQAPFSYLSIPTISGGTSFPIKNVNAFVESWAIQIGKTAEETAEILVLGTAVPSGTALNTVGTAKFPHSTDTPVYAIKYDQIVFKCSSSGTLGLAIPITDGTINIQPDSEFTQFDDTDGDVSCAYKASYINSVLGTASETSDSNWLTSSGFSFYSLAKIRERVKDKLFNSGYLKNDNIIDEWINEWFEILNNEAIAVNQDYHIGTVDIAYGTDGLGTITSNDFKDIRRVWFTSNGQDWYNATKLSLIDFAPNDTFNDTHPYFYLQGNTVIGKKPDGVSGTARVVYYKREAVLVNDTDELPMHMRSYTNSFVNYPLANAYYLDDKGALGDRYMGLANLDKDKFVNQITPRTKTGPKFITYLEPVSGDTIGAF